MTPCEIEGEFGSDDKALAVCHGIQQSQMRKAHDRKNEHNRGILARAEAAFPQHNGCIFITSGVVCGEAMQKHMEAIGLRIVVERSQADLFLAVNPLEIDEASQWYLVLAGGTAVSTRFLEHGEGPFVTWRAATQLLRVVHLTEQFATNHPEITAMIRQTAVKKGSRWTLIEDLECFINVCAKKRAQNRRSEVIAFIATEETGVFDCHCSSFDRVVALAAIQRIERSASSTGMCRK